MNKLLSVVICVIVGWSSVALSAEKAPKNPVESVPAKAKMTREQAIAEVDAFGKNMAKIDPNYARREEQILLALPLIAANYPPAQWLDRVGFLYAALIEFDKAKKPLDPEELLGRFLPDEKTKAGDTTNLLSDARHAQFLDRYSEIDKAMEAGAMSLADGAGRMYAAAFLYYPQDKTLHSLRQDRIHLVSRLDSGTITKSEFESLWSARRERFYSDVQQRNQAVAASAAAADSAQRSATISQVLNAASVSVNRAVQQMQTPQRSCLYNAAGGVITCF